MYNIFYHPIRFIKFETVAGDTDIILEIRYFVNPVSNQFLIFLVFRDSFNFFDCAENGRKKIAFLSLPSFGVH